MISFSYNLRRISKSSNIIARRLSFSPGTPKISQVEEVQIPVPWGHISGKWWGDKTQAPIIAIHDLNQNAAAFDNVIPQMNVSSVLAIDLPGHGKSSHFHQGRYLTHLEYIIALRYLSRKMPIGMISFLGHGFGSLLGLFYSAAYFKAVDMVMSVECSRHILSEFHLAQPNVIGVFADYHEEIEKRVPTASTEQEILAIIKSTSRNMSDEAAKMLFSRSVREENSKLFFTHDPRTAVKPLSYFTDENMLMMDEHVRTRTAIIRNVVDDELPPLSDEEAARPGCFDANTSQLIRRLGPKFVRERNMQGTERLRSSCRFFLSREMRSAQHILLDSSEQVASFFNEFLATDLEKHEYYSKTAPNKILN